MPPIKHSILGASKAHQWLECTPSVQWEQEFPEELRSDAAAEGTLAHALAEHYLLGALAGKKVRVPKDIKDDPLFHPSMVEHVSTYVDYIMEHYMETRNHGDAKVYVEQYVEFKNYVPDGYGTCDCVMVCDGTMHVFDFKYGKGVPVDAKDNPQLRLYALGALNEFGILYDITDVCVHIIQPRLDSITCDSVSVAELIMWAETYVKPRAELASKGEGDFVAGDHCRFCRCKNRCRAYQEKQFEIAALRFDENGNERHGKDLSDKEIGLLLKGVEELKRWASGIADWALDQATNHGAKFPGWKLVEGRANRKISDENAAIAKLEDAGFTPDAVTKLIGITELEKLVGAKELTTLLGDLIVKPKGKPVLVAESDKRPEISSTLNAQKVFTTID